MRTVWIEQDRQLLVECREDGTYWYINPNQKPTELRDNSSGFTRNDFVIIEMKQTKKKGIKKMNKKEYEATKVIVMSSTGVMTTHETEDEALEHIADVLEQDPRIKHTMFKAYQKVEPQRMSLKDLIKPITED